ncbi:aminoglycoside phosphotransferase family protein [Rossellomorea vietnamensis]|uniref:Aminoglycoside phosphotransferase family protein n=1 Tax=Rossellomorea vietnamensis TaxID=218284 RepID=A0ACD4C670_9BACI|nr:aminoglycoside phosphotransferase family protein [Rossellomorea vietnamensis]UXH44003.1 aminoglycoside phosphotransferase family protein [Rossellomorea vietnamensis]
MEATKKYMKEIIRRFPDIHMESVQVLGEGRMSIVLEVNDRWAFRFAKNEGGSMDLEKEISILPAIQPKLSLSIPFFEFVGRQENGLYFVGYRKLPGVLLEEDSISRLSRIQVRNLIGSLSKFMKSLQAISVESVAYRALPAVNLETKYLQLFKEAKEKVFPFTDVKTRDYISGRFNSFLQHPDYHTYTPTLIHGDLSPNHFLIDTETGELTGIIDFGDMCLCDPDYELLYILEDCGKEFTRDLLRSLGYSNVEERIEKISYFVTFDQIQYMIDGIIRGNEEWVEEGLLELGKELGGCMGK